MGKSRDRRLVQRDLPLHMLLSVQEKGSMLKGTSVRDPANGRTPYHGAILPNLLLITHPRYPLER